MSTARYALSALLGAAVIFGPPVLIRVLIDALALYHAAAMARIHNDSRRTTA